MKEYIKSYRVFASSVLFRGLIHVIYPLVIMFCVMILIGISLAASGGIQVAYQLAGGLIIVVELFIGYLMFGGIAASDTNKLEYLKTSVKGLPVLKKGLIVDAIRRWVRIALIQILPLFVCGEKMQPCVWMAVFITIAFTEIGLIVIRSTSSFTVFIVMVMVVSMVTGAVLGVGVYFSTYVWLLSVPLLLAVMAMVLSIRFVMASAGRSYYDARTEKELEAA